jgi:hypothetical protein
VTETVETDLDHDGSPETIETVEVDVEIPPSSDAP